MSLQSDNLMMMMLKCWAAQSNNLWLNHNHNTGNHWLIMETSYSVWSSVLFQDIMRNFHKQADKNVFMLVFTSCGMHTTCQRSPACGSFWKTGFMSKTQCLKMQMSAALCSLY